MYEQFALNDFKDTFFGSSIQQKPDGKGIFYREDGNIEKGFWKDGKLQGEGEIFFESVGIFKGEFENGEFKRGTFQKKEILYSGEFKNWKFHGWGTFARNGIIIYQGFWENSEYHGSGTIYLESTGKKKFQGSFLHGKKDGKGIEFNSSGTISRSGTWKEDVFVDGHVCPNIKKIYYRSGALSYEGEVKEDLLIAHGKGKKYHYNGMLCYDGDWKNGKPDGSGSLFSSDGILIYIGEFCKGKKKGQGILFHDNMVPFYEGHFANDDMNGKGIVYSSVNNFPTQEGFFKNGRLHGKGIIYNDDGKTIKQKGKFIHGNFVNEPELFIRKFLETNNESVMEKVLKSQIIDYVKKYFDIALSISKTKKELITQLHDIYQKEKKKETPISMEDLEDDLFGNPIMTPCLGNDGQIYDIESMNYLFQKNEQGEYVNIPYKYNENNERVPNYPVMMSGICLSSFSIISQE